MSSILSHFLLKLHATYSCDARWLSAVSRKLKVVYLPVTPVENCRQPLGGLWKKELPRVIWNLIFLQVLLIWIEAFQLCHFDFPLSVEIHVSAEEHEAQSGCVGGHGTHVNVY